MMEDGVLLRSPPLHGEEALPAIDGPEQGACAQHKMSWLCQRLSPLPNDKNIIGIAAGCFALTYIQARHEEESLAAGLPAVRASELRIQPFVEAVDAARFGGPVVVCNVDGMSQASDKQANRESISASQASIEK